MLLAAVSSQTFTNVSTFTTPGAGSWTVPAGVNAILVKGWGAGGGGGHGGDGGGGGFFSGYLAVTPGQTVYFTIPGGGGSNYDDFEECDSGTGCRTPNNWGSGGEALVFKKQNTSPSDYVIVGGGGGGGEIGVGGAGGGSVAKSGSADSGYSGGAGATSTSGYSAHSGATPAVGGLSSDNTLFCAGSDCESTGYWGGQGGYGWYSGYPGAGWWPGSGWGNAAGGGGGSTGYAGGFYNITNVSGSGLSPGGTDDVDYNSNYGGGAPFAGTGESGYLVIRY